MTEIVTIQTKNLHDGVLDAVPADKLLEGNPQTTTWNQDLVEGRVRTGVWEMTPGMSRSVKGNVYEYCHILQGVVEITSDSGETKRYAAGDNFVMKPGFVGTWRTIETVRKVFVIID